MRTLLRAARKTRSFPSVRVTARFFSSGQFADISANALVVTKASAKKPKPAKETLLFGHTFTDHLLSIDWDVQKGWHPPQILPFQNFSIHPAASSLHYGLECFEGMKAYLDSQNRIRMFRPMMNMQRMNASAQRLALPSFDGNQFLECIKKLIRLDKEWIPNAMGYSLYIRPTVISTYPVLGVGPAKSVKLFVILCPVGPYYKEGFNPVRLYADSLNVRAWPGGTGNIKCGGNYAMTIKAQADAAAKGFAQVMWLFGPEHYVTEAGTMNQFFFWQLPNGKRELVTAPLDGTILPGVTRDSILALARSWGEFEVAERHYTIHEVIKAIKENRMIEAFGSGTAAIVSPVNGFQFEGVDYPIPLNPSDSSAKAGALTQRFADTILNIQYGITPHEWSVVID